MKVVRISEHPVKIVTGRKDRTTILVTCLSLLDFASLSYCILRIGGD